MTVSCDYDPATVYDVNTVKASKSHKCCECQGVIRKGERHELSKGLWDGSWSSFRTCPDCLHVICELKRLIDDGRCGGWLHEGMMSQLEELHGGEQERRIVAMFNATSAARGGFRCNIFDEGDE